MKMRKKSLIMLVCTLTILSSVAFGTIAYLTDRATVSNRFTIGNVDIVVDETEVDENGDPVTNPEQDPNDPNDDNKRTEEGNDYPLIPGSEYVKDPTMTVKKGSREAYVRMMVTISNADAIDAIFTELQTQYPDKYANGFEPGDYVTDWDKDTWSCVRFAKDEAANTYTLELRYKEAVAATDDDDVTLPALFKTIIIPGELNNAQLATLEGFYIDVNGHAIQSTGFETADEAWAAFDAQTTATQTTATEDTSVQP